MACVWVVTCYYNKQWGVGTKADYGKSTTVTVTMPISFSDSPLAIIPTLADGVASATIIFPQSYTTSKITFCVDEWGSVTQTAKPMYVAIGK